METLRRQLERRRSALDLERSSWVSHWRELSENVLPRTGRFLSTDRNRGEKKHNLIYDNTATRALRVLGAGLLAGMTSPARPWFRLATPDTDLMEYAPVKLWLHQVTVLMRDIFSRSNTYRSLHGLYEELGLYGTGAAVILPDFNYVVQWTPFTAGEYLIATNANGEVDTLYREFDMTLRQMVQQFGADRLSPGLKANWDSQTGLESWHTVVHAIEPRTDRDERKKDAKNMPFRSVYYEKAGNDDREGILRESGFRRFPAVVPRWAATGGDVYGNAPGMDALGDIKQLQQQQFRKSQAVDYMADPPLTAPSSAKNSALDLLPGGISFVDSVGPGGGLRNASDVRLDLNALLVDIQDVRERIRQAFFADLFLMLANDDRSNITAREIAERHEEKLLMLGPVLERMHNELLAPVIDNAFDHMLLAGILPPPPPELNNMDLKVEFVSVLAQAQRAVGTGAVDRLLGTVAAMAGMKPEVLDKLDADQTVDAYAEMLGVDPNLIVADDRVAIIRQSRAQQEQAMQLAAMAQSAEQAAGAVEKLSKAETSGDNALSRLIQQFSGYAP